MKFKIENYNILRQDRLEDGGGILMGIRNNIAISNSSTVNS